MAALMRTGRLGPGRQKMCGVAFGIYQGISGAVQVSKVAAQLGGLHGDDVHPERAEHVALDRQIRADQARIERERLLSEEHQKKERERDASAKHLQVPICVQTVAATSVWKAARAVALSKDLENARSGVILRGHMGGPLSMTAGGRGEGGMGVGGGEAL